LLGQGFKRTSQNGTLTLQLFLNHKVFGKKSSKDEHGFDSTTLPSENWGSNYFLKLLVPSGKMPQPRNIKTLTCHFPLPIMVWFITIMLSLGQN
jgi:hypothetical protein